MNLVHYFDRAVRRYPTRPFLVHGHRTVTHSDAQKESIRLAGRFEALQVGPGVKVAIWSPNCIAAFEHILAILRSGAVWVTLGPAQTVDDLARAVNSTVTDVLLFSKSHAEQIPSVRSMCPCLRLVLCIDDADDDRVVRYGGPSPRIELTAGNLERADPVTTIFSSGGTTGDPKGVMLSARAWEHLVFSSSINVSHEHPVKLIVSPVFQTAGGVGFLADLVLGCTHVIVDVFEPDAVLSAIERYRVTYLFLPPTGINILLAHPKVREFDFSSLRYLIYGGAAIATSRVIEAMDVFGPVLATGFAQTETGGPVTCFSPKDHADALRHGKQETIASCGWETALSRVEVMDEGGSLLAPGVEGEIVVRSSHMMCGYYSPESNLLDVSQSRALQDWHRTGDIGRKDPDGLVYLLDRKTDMIISGGFNIFPAEIERFLEGQNGVRACAVVGVHDETMGESVCAVIERVPGATVDCRELKRLCRKNLSAMKTPASIVVWNELPKTASGKVLRRRVREQFWADRERKI